MEPGGSPAPALVAESRSRPADDAVDGGPPEFDEAAESAFLAEARDRGEAVVPAKPVEESPDDVDPKALPPLDELVNRIPADVRETLDDLFRARFTTVRRLPRKVFKS